MVVDVFQHCSNDATGGSLASVICVIGVLNFALSIFAAPVFFSLRADVSYFLPNAEKGRPFSPGGRK